MPQVIFAILQKFKVYSLSFIEGFWKVWDDDTRPCPPALQTPPYDYTIVIINPKTLFFVDANQLYPACFGSADCLASVDLKFFKEFRAMPRDGCRPPPTRPYKGLQ